MNKEKQKTSSVKFPNIFRFITDQKYFKKIVRHHRLISAGFVSAIILGAIVIVGADSYRNYKENEVLKEKRNNIENQIEFWEVVNKKYPGYRDSYFQLALLEYQLNDVNKARAYLKEVLTLDPNFKKGKELEKILNKK